MIIFALPVEPTSRLPQQPLEPARAVRHSGRVARPVDRPFRDQPDRNAGDVCRQYLVRVQQLRNHDAQLGDQLLDCVGLGHQTRAPWLSATQTEAFGSQNAVTLNSRIASPLRLPCLPRRSCLYTTECCVVLQETRLD
jgi:hypothetical protein